jgi:hypothetical protein
LDSSQANSLGGKENNSLLHSALVYGSAKLLTGTFNPLSSSFIYNCVDFKRQIKLSLNKKIQNSEELNDFSIRQARSLLHLQTFAKMFKVCYSFIILLCFG